MVTRTQEWPRYKDHGDARCSLCGGAMKDHVDQGFPDGNGRYSAVCIDCGMGTHYDIKREDS